MASAFKNFDWRTFVRGVAPILGSALFGPLGGQAVSIIGSALLGKPDATQAEVAAVLSSGQLSAEQIVAIKAADQDFAARMKAMDIDILKLNTAADAAEVADTANARATFGSNDKVFTLGIFILSGVAILMALVLAGSFLLMTGVIETQQSTLAVAMGLVGSIVGFLSAMATQTANFYFGSSKGSKDAGAQLGATLTEVLKKQGTVAPNDESALAGRPARETP